MAPRSERFDELSPEDYEWVLRRSASVAADSPESVAPEDRDLVEEILHSSPGDIAKEVADAT
jgi:hypothetical protein